MRNCYPTLSLHLLYHFQSFVYGNVEISDRALELCVAAASGLP